MDEGNEPLEGQVIASQFKILRKLGAGGMGAVYLAEQMEMDRKVVVKVLHPELTAQNPTAIERFRREAKAVAQLNHPNIVQVFVFGQAENGQMYLAMEYIEGRDLTTDLAKGPMPQPKALRILDQVCSALIEAHGAGIVHRDLKPENVMLADRHGNPDYVKVLDFGIAKLHDQTGGQPTLTQAGTVFGTPRYMSPEQVKGEPVDARSDIYALGVLFHEMLTAAHPFKAATTIDYLMKHVNEPVPLPHIEFAELDIQPRVESIVMRALEKEPADRYQSAAEMQRDVRLALRDFSEAVRGFPSAPPIDRAPPPARKTASGASKTATHQPDAYVPPGSSAKRKGVHPIVWALIGLLLVGGIVGVVFAVRPKGGGPGPTVVAGGETRPPEPTRAPEPTAATKDPLRLAGTDPEAPDTSVATDPPPEPTKAPPETPPDDPPDGPPDTPAPTTDVQAGDPVDGFPLPKDAKKTTSTPQAEMYETTLRAREIIGFYKAKLHDIYDVKDIPNGIQIEDEDSPFSFVTVMAMGGDRLTIVLSRNMLAAVNDKPNAKMEPAFGVTFPDDASPIVTSQQAVVARSRKPFREVCDYYAKSPEFGKHAGVVVARDDDGEQPYCSIANTNQNGSEALGWQAIAIVPDPMSEGAVMITVAGKATP